jgi:hypothetical protein
MVGMGSMVVFLLCLLALVQNAMSQSLFASIFEGTQIRSMTRGSRGLSITQRSAIDDATVSAAAPAGQKRKRTTNAAPTHFVNPSARKAMVDTNGRSGASPSSTASPTGAHKGPQTWNSTAPSTRAAATNATKVSGNATKTSTPPTKATEAPTKPKIPDPGEHHSDFKKPLPPSYNYKDDDVNYPGISLDSPLNPVVEDISQFLDDEVYPNATRSVLPPEGDQPTNWPWGVLGIFLGAAIVLFAATGYKNYKKRKAYTAVSSN